ncbi:hypothetical protein [Anaerovirgula multivorans]|nr:hypothetical protein [Anaerovirgula multivorans]
MILFITRQEKAHKVGGDNWRFQVELCNHIYRVLFYVIFLEIEGF